MIADFTLQALERAVSLLIPQDVDRPHYLQTDKQQHGGAFEYVEIVADPYTATLTDHEDLPCIAEAIVYANFVTEDDTAAEGFLATIAATPVALALPSVKRAIEALPEPYNRLRVYNVTNEATGINDNTDGTFSAQYQFHFTLQPLMIEQ